MGVKNPLIALAQFEARQASNAYKLRLRDEMPMTEVPALYVDREWRSKFEAERAAGGHPSVSLSAAIHRYCDTILPLRNRLRRVSATRNVLFRMAEMIGPEKPVGDIDVRDLSHCRDALVARGFRPNTVNRYVETVQILLNVCRANWQIIDRVPRLKKIPVKLGFRYLREDEEVRLLAHCPPHLRQLVQFILGTGARKSEALHLTWDDIHRGLDQRRTWVRFTMTKNGKPHAVPLPRSVEAMLEEMRQTRASNLKYVFTITPKRDRRLPDGRAVVRAGVASHYLYPDQDFRRARDNAGLSGVTIHSLRHTYASRLIMKGVPIYEVSKLLNHGSIQETMRYAHMDLSHLELAVQVLDQPRELVVDRDDTGQYFLRV